ncbi:hypothetical protein [Vibrio atypicus]|uniref:hypothetical protein n=1 Tax=Vibrio atypicus TaxID=558271 RepID=UPI003735E2CC
MNESINYAPLVTLGVFILGLLFTPILRKWEFYLASSKKKKLLSTELSDCRNYLKSIIIEHFKLLYTLEKAQDENGNVGKVPVSVVTTFDLDFLKEFYKDSLLLLSVDERHFVRGVPEKLLNLKLMSQNFTKDVVDDSYYNQRAIRNILWASSTLYCELNDYLNKEYDMNVSIGSIEATKKCLLEFGYTEEHMEFAQAFKSMLTEQQRNSLNSSHNFFVPE